MPPHILSHHDVKDAESHQPTIMRPPPIPSGNRKTSQISRKPLQLITRETPDNVILAAPDKQVLGWLMPCNESSSLPTVELRRNQLECKVGRQVSTNDLVLLGTHVSEYHPCDSVCRMVVSAFLTDPAHQRGQATVIVLSSSMIQRTKP